MLVRNTFYQSYNPKISFKNHYGYTNIKLNGEDKTVNNYTTFFRDFETLKFVKNYLTKNFPHGTEIAEFGCSLGQKPYSLMILLDKENKDKRYKCTGYDFAEVIDKIREVPLYGISEFSCEERCLFDNYDKSHLFEKRIYTPQEAEILKNKFYEYFQIYTPEKVSNAEYKRRKQLLQDGTELKKQELQKARLTIAYNDIIRQNNTVLTPTKKAQNCVEFKTGDINEIDKLLPKRKTGAVIFQNALYHILANNEIGYEIEDLEPNVHKAAELFKKINKVLEPGGIFVLGSLASDHLYSFEKEDKTHLAYQDGKRIRVYTSSPIHDALKENGFEPVFFEEVPDGTAYVDYPDVHLPSVWKKTKDV